MIRSRIVPDDRNKSGLYSRSSENTNDCKRAAICYNRLTMKKQATSQGRIVRIPGLVGGKPVINGTRIPVDLILERLAHDLDLNTLFEDYPHLTKDDIKACLAYAKELVEEEELFPASEEKTYPGQANA